VSRHGRASHRSKGGNDGADTASGGRFSVRVTRDVDATVRDVRTPKQVRTAYVAAYRELQARSCAAAGYRLIGPGDWPRFCVRALPHVWRLVMDFPAIDEVRRPILEPHTDATDPYQRLADLLGVDRAPGAAGTGLKPGCCSDHGAPPEPSALP